MAAVSQEKTLKVTIRDPGFIVALINDIDLTLEEMRGINVRNTPVKYETKKRWEDKLAEVRTFLARFVPSQEGV